LQLFEPLASILVSFFINAVEPVAFEGVSLSIAFVAVWFQLFS
jgi:hypothetical protein